MVVVLQDEAVDSMCVTLYESAIVSMTLYHERLKDKREGGEH